MFDITTTEAYKVMSKQNPSKAEDWKITAESFPHEGIRAWMVTWENFCKAYNLVSGYYGDSNAYWSIILDEIPELKEIGKDADRDAIDEWADEKLNWLV